MLRDQSVLDPILEDSRLPELLEELNVRCQTITGCSFPVVAIFDEKIKMQVVKNWMK